MKVTFIYKGEKISLKDFDIVEVKTPVKKHYLLKDNERDIISVATLTGAEYKNFVLMMKKHPKSSVDIEGCGKTLHMTDLTIKPVTKKQYEVLDNTRGIELYEDWMNEFEFLEGKRKRWYER
jgi:hypothetical protein